MSQHECKKCGETKSAGDMINRNGKPSRLCRACFGLSFAGKRGGGRRVRKTEKTLAAVVEKVSRRKALPEVVISSALEIEHSYGCRAAIEDGYIAIEQDQVDESGAAVTARLLLSRGDLRRLVEWAG